MLNLPCNQKQIEHMANKTSFEDMAAISAAYIEARDNLARVINYKGDKRRRAYKRIADASHIWLARMNNFAALLGLPTAGEVFYNDPEPEYCKQPAQAEPARPAAAPKSFKVNGYFVDGLYSCIYLQIVNGCAEQCRLLEEYRSPLDGVSRYTALKVRRVRVTAGGDSFVMYRGRRLTFDKFLRAGGPWSGIPAGYTIVY